DWRAIVEGLAAVNSFAVEGAVFSAASGFTLSRSTVDCVALRLYETFPRALYEILKEDFAHEGKAYGGLLLQLVGKISATQVESLKAAYEVLERVERMEGKVNATLGNTEIIIDKLDLMLGDKTVSAAPARLAVNLPSANRIFTGRRDVLEALKVELEKSKRASLSGMPGVGKTQTASEYAHEQYAAQAYDYIIYARAASETELLTDLVSAAKLLNLPARDNPDINFVAATVKVWLEGSEKWLLIFDNADDLAFVRRYLPATSHGHVLFTRRPADAGGVAHTIKIKKMTLDEGALLLLRRAELATDADKLETIAPESAERARAIAHELDGLPLSLDIAGAFIKETAMSLLEYLELYRTEGRSLRQERDPNADYQHSVATAFALAFKQVAAPEGDTEEAAVVARAAADVLCLCAFLAPDAIPLELLLGDGSALGEDLQRALGNKVWRRKAIARATRFSLLDAHPQTQNYDIHREVQAVMRDEMDADTQRFWTERALQVLAEAFPDVSDFDEWKAGDLFLPHAQICLEHSGKLQIETETVARLSNQAGFHLESRARYEEAEPLLEQALELEQKILGPEHPDVALSMNNLAMLYFSQGRYDDAEPLLLHSLELYQKAFGEEHSNVAMGLNNLAEVYRIQGRYEEAEPLY
ncbi:MAG TPA: tetratricopeptide repeat protein, partial [Pyrinomonadaceae bacterium]